MQLRKIRAAIALVAVAAIAAGAGFWIGRTTVPIVQIPAPPPQAAAPTTVTFTAIAHSQLPGWPADDFIQAVPALNASCAALTARPPESIVGEGVLARTVGAWKVACAQLGGSMDAATVRRVLETAFDAYAVSATSPDGERGMFTGYYEAELRASLVRDARYRVPVYGVPRDLVAVALPDFVSPLPPGVPRQIVGRVVESRGRAELAPYFNRSQIDSERAVADRADVLIWADDPVAVHILHIQGSGRVTLPDGQRMRVGFAGHNGHRFVGIGSILIKAGVLKSGEASMDKVRDWLTRHPAEAETYMNQNNRYIFFQLRPDAETTGPIGAQGVALTAGRSLAVDMNFIPLGAPLWLDTVDPDGKPLRRLVVAQDTGAAIVGVVRGDYYWGTGEPAFAQAARMRSPGRYAVLVPRAP